MKKDILEMLKECEKNNDVMIDKTENKIELTFNDFEGFDDDYDEIYRNYVNPILVEEIIEYIEKNNYLLNNTKIEIDYLSQDI